MKPCSRAILACLRVDVLLILAQVNAPSNIGFYVKLGSTVDIMEAASGYVILAHHDAAQSERTLVEWSRETGNKPPRDLAVHLARIQKAGYDKRASYLVKGIVNVSFPIFDDRGSAVGALTVPYIQYNGPEVPVGNVIDALRRSAAEITAALGGRNPVPTSATASKSQPASSVEDRDCLPTLRFG